MNSKFKSIFRRYLVFFCSLILAFNTILPAYASSSSGENGQNFNMTTDTVMINGVTLTKEEIKEATQNIRFIKKNNISSNAPITCSAIIEYENLSFDPESASAIMSLGLGIYALFGKINYTFMLVEHNNEWWKCSVDGYRLNIYCTSEGMIINGYSVSYSWLTDILMNSIDAKAQSGSSESNGERTKGEEETEALEDILDDAKPLPETKGKSKQWEKTGGFEEASEDYNKLNPSDSKEINTPYGKGKTGTLSNGDKVNVRPGSTEGSPTLEIQKGNGVKIKIRYK